MFICFSLVNYVFKIIGIVYSRSLANKNETRGTNTWKEGFKDHTFGQYWQFKSGIKEMHSPPLDGAMNSSVGSVSRSLPCVM